MSCAPLQSLSGGSDVLCSPAESIGAQSDDEVFEEDRPKLSAADYNTLRSQNYATYGPESKLSPAGGARSVFSVPAYRGGVHRAESVYGGTKSLYACSPPPSRAHLARYVRPPRSIATSTVSLAK